MNITCQAACCQFIDDGKAMVTYMHLIPAEKNFLAH